MFHVPSIYTRGKTTGLGKYNVSDVVHSLGGGPDTFISDVKRFSEGPGIVISLVHSTLPQQQDRILILLSFLVATLLLQIIIINLHGELYLTYQPDLLHWP